MASLVVIPSQNSFYMYFSGLQYPDSAYTTFAFRVGGNTYNSTGNGVTIPVSCGTTYTCSGAVLHNGTWYTIDSGTNYSSLACAVYPSSPSWTATATSNSITTYVTFGANTHHVNVYLPGASTPTLTLYSNGNVTHTGLTANTNYTLYIQAWDSTETYGSGSQSYVVKTAGARPSNFSGWGITVAAGQPCAITAAKWNEFTAKINAFRVYKGLSNYGFTTAVPGNDIYAWMANQLISGMTGLGVSLPSTVSSGGDFTAAWLNALTTALNSVT